MSSKQFVDPMNDNYTIKFFHVYIYMYINVSSLQTTTRLSRKKRDSSIEDVTWPGFEGLWYLQRQLLVISLVPGN